MSIEVVHARALVPPETDLLVVLGKNIGVGWTRADIQQSPDYLSVDSSINIQAAGELYRPGMDILMSGGRTLGSGFPSQPAVARDYLHKKYPYIPLEAVLLDEEGPNTPASAESVAAIAQKGAYQHISLLSVGYHVKNAARLFRNYGVPVGTAIASEDILADIAAWRERERIRGVKGEANKELVRGLTLTLDRKGKFIRWWTAGRVEE
jgi:hypothetical protein